MNYSNSFNDTADEAEVHVIDIFPENYRRLGVEDGWNRPNRAYTKNQTALAFNDTADEAEVHVIDIFPENYRRLGVEDGWNRPNRAYTKNQTALAAVWPGLMNTNYEYCYTTKSTPLTASVRLR